MILPIKSYFYIWLLEPLFHIFILDVCNFLTLKKPVIYCVKLLLAQIQFTLIQTLCMFALPLLIYIYTSIHLYMWYTISPHIFVRMSCKHRYVYMYECECIYDVLLTRLLQWLCCYYHVLLFSAGFKALCVKLTLKKQTCPWPHWPHWVKNMIKIRILTLHFWQMHSHVKTNCIWHINSCNYQQYFSKVLYNFYNINFCVISFPEINNIILTALKVSFYYYGT